MEIKYRNRIRKPKIVVICDVSTSMRFCSELMLSFLFALQGQIRKTHAFAFIDHLESISEDFNGSDADEAVASVLWRMPSGHYNTDLGWSLNNFNSEHLDTLNGQTTLIIVGDGAPRSYRFDEMMALINFQCDMEALLLKTGWSFIQFSPERRTGKERRTWPRMTERRRWWTDGQLWRLLGSRQANRDL